MKEREVMAYSPYCGHWVLCTAIDIGRPDDTRIAAKRHPAIQEDAWLAATPAVTEHTRRDRIENYLREHGPAITSKIAVGTDCNPGTVIQILKRDPGMFQIVDYVDLRYGRAAIWGLK